MCSHAPHEALALELHAHDICRRLLRLLGGVARSFVHLTAAALGRLLLAGLPDHRISRHPQRLQRPPRRRRGGGGHERLAARRLQHLMHAALGHISDRDDLQQVLHVETEA